MDVSSSTCCAVYLLGALASLVLGIIYATQAGDRMQNYCAAHSSACPDDLEGLKSVATLMSTFAMFLAITVLLVGFRLTNLQVNAIFTSLDSTYSPVTARLAFARGQRVVIPGEVPRLLFYTVLSASNITRVTVEGLRTLFSSCSRWCVRLNLNPVELEPRVVAVVGRLCAASSGGAKNAPRVVSPRMCVSSRSDRCVACAVRRASATVPQASGKTGWFVAADSSASRSSW